MAITPISRNFLILQKVVIFRFFTIFLIILIFYNFSDFRNFFEIFRDMNPRLFGENPMEFKIYGGYCKSFKSFPLRTPVPLWYASFVAKPELDFVIETNLNTKYSSTIENIFASHLQRLVTRKHTVPKFKVRLKSIPSISPLLL